MQDDAEGVGGQERVGQGDGAEGDAQGGKKSGEKSPGYRGIKFKVCVCVLKKTFAGAQEEFKVVSITT